ncbi:MAG: VCBS repeat-containing protein, partial [Bacteroidota bacterium]
MSLLGAMAHPLWGQTLENVTLAKGIKSYNSDQRFGTGVSCFDINGDDWLDLHVSTAFGEPDHIYLNQKGQGFKEVADELGLDLRGGSIASLWLDYDGDRLVDLLVMNSCHEVVDCDGKTLQLFRQT